MSKIKTDKPSLIIIAAVITFSLFFFIAAPFFMRNTWDVPNDFSAFFFAGKLAAEGLSAKAYDLDFYQQRYAEYFVGYPNGYGWFYPPHALLPHHFLSSFSFPIANSFWLVSTYLIYLLGMKNLAHERVYWVFIAFAPAVIINMNAGQTGFLTAGLLAAFVSLSCRQDKPTLFAGIPVGLLTVKPHLWVMLPIIMIARKQWSAIAIAVLTVLLLVGTSLAFYGFAPWVAMANSVLGGYESIHADNTRLIGKMATLSALMTSIGLDALGIPLQILTVIMATVAIFWLVKHKSDQRLIFAFAICASFISAPHNMLYDQLILLIPCLIALPFALAKDRWILPLLGLVFFWPYINAAMDWTLQFPWSAVMATCLCLSMFGLAYRNSAR